jgi:putative ABC transport system ATP-binding protein
MYKLTDVTRLYQKGRLTVPAVRDVNLEIPDGDWLAVQGRTGHGKTTLLQLLGGLDHPTSGTIELDGQDLTRLREAQVTHLRATSIGFVFQTFNLVPTLTAADNVEAALIPLGMGWAERRRRTAAALDNVGLSDRARHLPSELSGGQQQRVAIARALINQPGLLLADEPTGNLDSATGQEIIELLLDLRQQHGTTVLIATHDPTIAEACDHVIRLRDGRIDLPVDA